MRGAQRILSHSDTVSNQYLTDNRRWPTVARSLGGGYVRRARYSLAEVIVVFLVSIVLVGVPATAAPTPSASLGVVSQATHASRGTTALTNGAAIFDGDTLLTDASGNLQAQLGQSHITILPNSNVLVHRLSNGFGASLTSGTIAFSTSGETIQVEADGATIQSKNGQPTIAQISYVNASELLLTSRRGELLVSFGNETKIVDEGASYRMKIQPGSGPAPEGAFSTGQDWLYFVLIPVAAGGIAYGIYAGVSGSSSPSAP